MANPLGRLSMRKLLSFVAALIVTVFAYTLAAAPTAFAADAAWNGGNLSYESNQYNAMADAKEGDSTGLPAGSKVYGYSTNPADGPQKAYLIYFEPGVDPKTATSAKTVNYSYTPPSTYTNKSSVGTISIDSSSANNPTSTCTVEGVGWIVCSLSSFLAEGMDNIFNLLTGFVAVQPIRTSDQSGDLYKAWDIMRSFANIVFIIGFLVIIYSQLTSTGVSNYGIKKLLPRIIIAAILVNISYYICAIAVDITNILGYSLQHIFIQVRENLFGIHGNTWSNSMGNWESVTGFVLSGGATVLALGAGGAAALAATGGTAAAAIFLLLPILVGALITILVVLLILAARQAIIIILIIISPLAFVAYLLPGTEKWFEKWKDLFMTMMIFFPAFSMVFGGAQLAGAVIIQNATSINLIILGLAVQVAPLAIAPLLMRLSGGFLNRIAGIVNNPGKGLVDRTRKWAGEHADYHRQRGTSGAKWNGDPGTLRKRNFVRRAARGLDFSKRNLAEKTKNAAGMTDNAYHSSEKYQQLHEVAHQIENAKQRIETDLKIHIQAEVNKVGSKLYTDNVKLEAGKLGLESENTKTTALIDELKSGRASVPSGELSTIMSSMHTNAEMIALNGMRNESAKRAWNEDFTKKLENNTSTVTGDGRSLQDYAGGIQGIAGAQRALASAISAQSKAHGESVSNATTIINHGNYTDDVVGELALGNSGKTGIIVTDDMREAAIIKIAGGANTSEILKLMENIEINPSKENQDFRQAFADTLIANSNKPKFAGAGIIAEIKKGNAPAPGKARIDKFVSDTINADKMGSADLLVTHDKDYLSAVLATLKSNSSGVPLRTEALARIKSEINKAKTNDLYSGKIGERATVLDEIDKLI